MYCKHCGKELPPQADVCLNCGAFVSYSECNPTMPTVSNEQRIYKILSIGNFVLSILESTIFLVMSIIGYTFGFTFEVWKSPASYAHEFHGNGALHCPLIFIVALVATTAAINISLSLFNKTKRKMDMASMFITAGALFISTIILLIYTIVN